MHQPPNLQEREPNHAGSPRRPHTPRVPRTPRTEHLPPLNQENLPAISQRIRTEPGAALHLTRCHSARLEMARRVLEQDPDARERYGDAETVAALLLALARKAPRRG